MISATITLVDSMVDLTIVLVDSVVISDLSDLLPVRSRPHRDLHDRAERRLPDGSTAAATEAHTVSCQPCFRMAPRSDTSCHRKQSVRNCLEFEIKSGEKGVCAYVIGTPAFVAGPIGRCGAGGKYER